MRRSDAESETIVTCPLTQNPYADNESRESLLVAHTLRGDGFDASEDGTGRGTPIVACLDASYAKLQGCSGQDLNHGHSHLIAFCNAGGDTALSCDEHTAPPITTRHGDPGLIAFDTTQITSATNRSNPQDGDPSHRLTSEGHPPAIAFTCKDSGADAGDTAPTLRAMGHDSSHANAGGQVAVALPILEAGARTGKSTDDPRAGMGVGEPGDPMFTLQSGKQHAVGFQSSQSGVREVESHATLDSNNGSRRHNGVVQSMAVRRLTPRECERLQGFEDDFTLITYRGKPAADGPRYKALGNSMAVPVMKLILDRIKLVDQITKGAA